MKTANKNLSQKCAKTKALAKAKERAALKKRCEQAEIAAARFYADMILGH